jgi:hypothetical protein
MSVSEAEGLEIQAEMDGIAAKWGDRLQGLMMVAKLNKDAVRFRFTIANSHQAIMLLASVIHGLNEHAQGNGALELVKGLDLITQRMMEVFDMEVVIGAKQ